MYISSSPHETKVAVLEDDQLVEVYFERDTDVGLVGGIYKGRVSRVLPGMQSAFVDIGLDRDAFLYVSDFFYEDQEEYDKVFEEAEARATKFTAQEGLPAAGVQAPSMPALTEAPAAAVEAVVPPAEVPAAVTAPPAPPPGASQSHERRPFDQRRGRRRRHRGRPGFGENRYADRKFTPSQPSPEPAGTFEILPGESLAKYGHATAAATEEGSPGLPEESPAPEIAGLGSAPLRSERFSAPAGPFVEPEAAAPSPATLGMPPAESVSNRVFEEASAAGIAHIEAPPEELAPLAPPPFEPAHQIREPQPAVEFAPPYGPVEEAEQSEATEVAFQETMPDVALGAEPCAAEPGLEAEDVGDSELLEEVEEIEEAAAEEAFPAPTVPEAETHARPDTQAPASGEPSIGEVPGSPDDRSYTLREPHQRPRFAPRRRRGRRGPNAPGGPRRHDNRHEPSRPGNHQPVQIAEVLKEGQEILVQIAKEPLGSKGARITSHIALPGRYLVYMPTIDHIGVSRKIASEEERLRLRNIILENKGALTGGFIVRTAGQGRSEDEFKADLKFLSTLWSEIRSKADRLKAPALIHRDLDLVQRLLRDLLTPDFKCVRVDNETDYERVLDFVNRCQPALIGKIKLYTRDTPLFEEFGLQQELEKALKPKVWLKSGGYIVINQTEALVAVDVNTGKYVGKTNRLEDTIVKTNVDAVNEIVRQVRLRDLGGIIVIDFIDMDERKNRAKVVQALEEALRSDRAPTKVISFHDFGLVAVTRKRVKQSLERTLCQPCPYCTGSGWIKSVNTVCNEILAEARKMAKEIDGNVITLRVNPEVAKALKAREGGLVSELESLTKKDVIIKSDPTVHQERFEIF
jgi:ribonuclease G